MPALCCKLSYKEPNHAGIIFWVHRIDLETSELQHQAFNEAFAEHDINWPGHQATYQGLLSLGGGDASNHPRHLNATLLQDIQRYH